MYEISNINIDEFIPDEEEKFVIDNDSKAEWALERIKTEKQDMERLIKVCEDRIADYQQKIEQFKQKYEQRTSYLKTLLHQYFLQVPHKKTKTQETYELPSGKLKLKYPGPEFVRSDEKLVEYLENVNPDLIKIKKIPDWASFKPFVTVKYGKAVDTTTGEIVEGVTVVERPPEFIVEV